MKMPRLSLSGQCRCGQVKIEVTAACHCTLPDHEQQCFFINSEVPSSDFKVTEGEPVIGGLHGAQQHHYFCDHCMIWMYTCIKGVDGFLNVRPLLFEDHTWFVPFIETMTKEKLAWAQTPATHSYEGSRLLTTLKS